MMTFSTHTTDTFTTTDGKTVRCEEILEGAAKSVLCNGIKRGMSREDMEDTFQDACYKAWKYRKSYNPKFSSARTYGSRIADNCGKDKLEKVARLRNHFSSWVAQDKDGDDCVRMSVAGYRGDEYEADRVIRTEEAMAFIESAMARLSENHRYILGLHLKGLKPKKMAEQIGCTSGAAATLLCRARKALARELGREFLSEYGMCA
jgi:RNA polymerase sigma factor (sigma-70 family)